MAIIVEEERSRTTITPILGWIVTLSIVGFAAYYIFFAVPESVTFSPPTNFQNIEPITQIGVNPNTVLQSPMFQSLKQYIAEPTGTAPAHVGRPNPFIAP